MREDMYINLRLVHKAEDLPVWDINNHLLLADFYGNLPMLTTIFLLYSYS